MLNRQIKYLLYLFILIAGQDKTINSPEQKQLIVIYLGQLSSDNNSIRFISNNFHISNGIWSGTKKAPFSTSSYSAKTNWTNRLTNNQIKTSEP